MPNYEYECTAGHRFTRPGRMDGTDAPTACPELLKADDTPEDKAGEWVVCAEPLRRVLSAPASIFPGAASWRHGHKG